MRRRVLVYLLTVVVLGALGGLLWARVTPLASYTVAEGLAAFISERSQATIVAAEPDERTGLRRLYVVLTRAVSELDIVHTLPLPEELRAA